MAKRERRTVRRPIPINKVARVEREGYLSGVLDKDVKALQDILSDSFDVVVRHVRTASDRRCTIFYITHVVDVSLISDYIIGPLQNYSGELEPEKVKSLVARVPQINYQDALDDMAPALSLGNAILMMDGATSALLLNVTQFAYRAIGRSESEDVIIGPHDSFTEALEPNLALLRSRLRTPQFKIKTIEIGQKSRTTVAILYLENVVQEKLVKEVEQRLSRIQIDVVYGVAFLSDFLEDEPTSLFPLARPTERPDRVISALTEGRVAIIADGGPTALIAPTFLPEFIQAAEDYYEKPLIATFFRFIRLLSLALSIFLPGVWVALLAFHHGILPAPLLGTVIASRIEVPFPVVIEATLMLVAFDIIIEASTRLPRQVGQAIGIVGALVVGQSAVEANLVSPTMVIVVALTGLATFTLPTPAFIGSARLLKYFVLLLSSIVGLYGTVISFLILVIQASSLRSFGYPSMYPIGPLNIKGLADISARPPNFALWYRPRILADENIRRMDKDLMPKPNKGGGEDDKN